MSTSNRSGASPVTYAYLRSDGTAYVVAGSALAGLAAYAYQLMGGRVLGAEAFAPVSSLLTIHFLTFIVILMPIEQFTVRRLTIDHTATRLPARAFWLGGVTVAAATVFAWLGVDDFLNGDYRFIGFTALTVAVHFVFAGARGHLAGRRRFKDYGVASGVASLLRLAIAIGITLIRPSASGFAIALLLAPLVVLLWHPFRAPGRPVEESSKPDGGQPGLLGGLVLAAAASQALLLVGPIAVGFLGGSAVEVSIAFAAFTLGRAPLVFGYNLLARVLPPFTKMAVEGQSRELTSWARGMALAGTFLSVVGGLLGWWLGPWVVRTAFGPEFVASNSTTAAISVGVVLAGAGLFVGQILVANARTGRLALAWLAGLLASSLSVLLTPEVPTLLRVSLAFIVGEAVALVALVRGAVASAQGKTTGSPTSTYELAKRTLDIATSLTLLILLSPVLVVVGVAIRIDSAGPIFFRQQRVGKGGAVFKLVKVRTMRADADESVFADHLARLEASRQAGDDVAIRIEDDERTTRLGGFLRRWSIDEIPNLWNVLRGQLSLVGPRPLVPSEAELIGLDHPRFTVKPGMTGLAQVNGRDAISMAERSHYDESYVASRSLKGDVGILKATVTAIFRGRDQTE